MLDGSHDIARQLLTGVCCVCREVACDDGCIMEGIRSAGDDMVRRTIVVNRTTGAAHVLSRSTGEPYPQAIADVYLAPAEPVAFPV